MPNLVKSYISQKSDNIFSAIFLSFRVIKKPDYSIHLLIGLLVRVDTKKYKP